MAFGGKAFVMGEAVMVSVALVAEEKQSQPTLAVWPYDTLCPVMIEDSH